MTRSVELLAGLAVVAATIAVSGLLASSRGRAAYLRQVDPVIRQYREVLQWEELRGAR